MSADFVRLVLPPSAWNYPWQPNLGYYIYSTQRTCQNWLQYVIVRCSVFGKIYFSLSVSPQDINKHVKTSVNNLSGAVHYMAPESGLIFLVL